MGLQIILGDKNPELVDAWNLEFKDCSDVRTRGGNILLVEADALVSPANSFGFMDGGLDWSISELFDWKIQSMVQEVIRNKHDGELVVGHAEIIPTRTQRFPYLICAPTMRVPHDVSGTVNAFLATRAALIAVQRFNGNKSDQPIESIAFPGLCTGFGKMPYVKCAKQMKAAYDQVIKGVSNRYRSLEEAIEDEKKYKCLPS